MKRVVIVLQVQNQNPPVTIAQLTDQLGLNAPVGAPLGWNVNAEEAMAKVANLISACQGSVLDAAVKVAVTDDEPTVTLSGSGAVERTFTLSNDPYVP
jgi:hypothetical protein